VSDGVAERSVFDLDLLIERQVDEYRACVLRSPAGDGQAVTFARPFSDPELKSLLQEMGRSRGRTRRIESAPVAAAKQFGGRLFSAVFAGQVGECLRRSVDRARAEDATLRIRLRLSDCPELADVPWEFLYDKDDDWFVALSEATPVVRYLQLPNQPRPMSVTLPLRVLAIRSEPVGFPQLDLEAEWSQVMASLGEFINEGAIIVTDLVAPTLSELRRVLLRERFHVLHYMGHGGFTAQDGGVLLFTDRAGRGAPVTGDQLSVMLRDHTSLRLAVLNACEAGRTDPADPFGGIADTLVRRGIPAVIAMQFEITDTAAIEFAPALYGALAAGRPVDAAVAEARKAIYAVSQLEWATPVLHLRADNAHLFDITQDGRRSDDALASETSSGDRTVGIRRSRVNPRVLAGAGVVLLVAAVLAAWLVIPPYFDAKPTGSTRPTPPSTSSFPPADCVSGTLELLGSAFVSIAEKAANAYMSECKSAKITPEDGNGKDSAWGVGQVEQAVSAHSAQAASMIAAYDGTTTTAKGLTPHPVGMIIYSVVAHTGLIPGPDITVAKLKQLFGQPACVPDRVTVSLQAGSANRVALLRLFGEQPSDSSTPEACSPPSGHDTANSYEQALTIVNGTPNAIGYVAVDGVVDGNLEVDGHTTDSPNVSVVSIGGVAPTPENVHNGSYHFAAAENLYTVPHPSLLAQSFLAYLPHYLAEHQWNDFIT
jgi:hypothetical protein